MPKQDEEILEEEELEVEEVSEEEIEEETPDGEEEAVEEVDKDPDKEVDDTPAEEPPKFTLSEEEPPADDKEVKDDKFVDIVHNGQVYTLTKEKAIELCQKGFDYDYKVGPHGKIVQMIETDPNLAKVVDDYWKDKVNGGGKDFEVLPQDDFDTDEEWLQANVKKAVSEIKAQIPITPPSQSMPQGGTMADALRMRDPEHFNKVYPKLNEYAEQLTMAEYKKVDSDMTELCRFYDYVKEREREKSKPPKTRDVKPQGFRVKSGGGGAPKSDSISPAWKLSKEDFQKQIDAVKGYT